MGVKLLQHDYRPLLACTHGHMHIHLHEHVHPHMRAPDREQAPLPTIGDMKMHVILINININSRYAPINMNIINITSTCISPRPRFACKTTYKQENAVKVCKHRKRSFLGACTLLQHFLALLMIA